LFEVKIITSDRNQVRYKRGEPQYNGPEYLNTTLDSILESDIPLDCVSIYNDNQNFDSKLPSQSKDHINALERAEQLGCLVVQNNGNGFSENSIEALSKPLRKSDTEYLIVLEDDVQVSKRILYHTKEWIYKTWSLRKQKRIHFGTLFGISGANRAIIPFHQFWGGQALVFHTSIIDEFVQTYHQYDELIAKKHNQPKIGMVDMDYPRIIHFHFDEPIWNCVPSLVQHSGIESSWNPPAEVGGPRQVHDFKPD